MPTYYDPEENYFDTSPVESEIENLLSVNTKATMIIKSTVTVGYTVQYRGKFQTENIFFTGVFKEGESSV